MLKIKYTNTFEKDVKRAKKRGLNIEKLKEAMRILAEGQSLSGNYRDHALIGKYIGRRECHIEPNWLLIYKKESHLIIFERTGTHSDLFRS